MTDLVGSQDAGCIKLSPDIAAKIKNRNLTKKARKADRKVRAAMARYGQKLAHKPPARWLEIFARFVKMGPRVILAMSNKRSARAIPILRAVRAWRDS